MLFNLIIDSLLETRFRSVPFRLKMQDFKKGQAARELGNDRMLEQQTGPDRKAIRPIYWDGGFPDHVAVFSHNYKHERFCPFAATITI